MVLRQLLRGCGALWQLHGLLQLHGVVLWLRVVRDVRYVHDGLELWSGGWNVPQLGAVQLHLLLLVVQRIVHVVHWLLE